MNAEIVTIPHRLGTTDRSASPGSCIRPAAKLPVVSHGQDSAIHDHKFSKAMLRIINL